MKNGLHEILRTGQAPGFNTKAPDPGGPDVAVPRALRQLEEKHSADRIAKDSGFTVKQLKKAWPKI